MADCSSFIWRCYKYIGWNKMMGLTGDCGSPSATINGAGIIVQPGTGVSGEDIPPSSGGGVSNTDDFIRVLKKGVNRSDFMSSAQGGTGSSHWIFQKCSDATANNAQIAQEICTGYDTPDAALPGHLYPGDIFVRGWNSMGHSGPGHIIMVAGTASGFTTPTYDQKSLVILQMTAGTGDQGSHCVNTVTVTPKSCFENYEYWAQPHPYN
jgi:hypothetical protein